MRRVTSANHRAPAPSRPARSLRGRVAAIGGILAAGALAAWFLVARHKKPPLTGAGTPASAVVAAGGLAGVNHTQAPSSNADPAAHVQQFKPRPSPHGPILPMVDGR